MRVVNLLEFLNTTKDLFTLNYAKCSNELVNFLDLMTEDEQFTQKIDLGIFYVNQKSFDQYTIVDGLNRLLSLSLLLHAVCECYKKTTAQNEKAIKTIRKKYLLNGSRSKLRLTQKDAEIYNKIINGERLSGHEKRSPMFILLHNFWTQIKTENLQAAKIFTMLKKISVTIVETEDVPVRDLYYKLNQERHLDQLLLIEDYVAEKRNETFLQTIRQKYFPKDNDITLFLKDFFITKFNYKKFDNERLYESFVNFFETMTQYIPTNTIINNIIYAASLYYDILNVNFEDEEIKKAFIRIKKASGEDTFAYILEVYSDYKQNNISETTFIEILNTIAEYLNNRKENDNHIAFNELIQYLNAFLSCK